VPGVGTQARIADNAKLAIWGKASGYDAT